MSRNTILLVDDDASLIELLAMRLEANNYHVLTAHRGTQALQILQQSVVDLVITDLRMAHMDGFELFENIKKNHVGLPVIMMTAHGSIPDAVDAMQQGFVSFLSKPIESKALLEAIENTLKNNKKRDGATNRNHFHGLVYQSTAMHQVVQHIQALAPSQANILIQGASGTGKEVTANAIHKASNYCDGPFIAINCGAVPAHLLESELFGHKKGAFTGAMQDKVGLVQSANGGTLFLDEIGDMPMDLQVKLLRVLQERTVRPVGGQVEQSVDIRFVSASHKNLQQAVADKEFREDLYYRLNVVSIHLPALKDRPEDIPLLANRFVNRISGGQKVISPQAMTCLLNYHWPGNVRQLNNIVEHAVALSSGKLITADIIENAIPELGQASFKGLNDAKKQFEYDYIQKVLSLCQGNVAEAAKLAQRNRSDFYKLLKKHQISC
ncbi:MULTISPECIES: sigma-54-dependent transcriptional regulator [Pseudoalteromonas]|uniref:Two-component system response regulator GlrR n=1 Tax=Pseudoalteromonas amylolytica TaxID=1859457 RepID=A0A1S1MP65_9GAMM|nr:MULTISPECIES: sigma-54 dependent transcriptional regulator [Pseudoalteromonas]OHU84340.1 two-component system response regulator GlrR [Pseudoalteromonas sp. JW3]OHU87121.1 two-component system response regulator GlrR [Pseudoalteromonas amylolytica]